jgi:hypothetical protein
MAPRSWSAVTHNRPSCASTIDRQIDRPIPIPSVLVVNIGLNIRSTTPGLRPFPVSSTDTITYSERWSSAQTPRQRRAPIFGHCSSCPRQLFRTLNAKRTVCLSPRTKWRAAKNGSKTKSEDDMAATDRDALRPSGHGQGHVGEVALQRITRPAPTGTRRSPSRDSGLGCPVSPGTPGYC